MTETSPHDSDSKKPVSGSLDSATKGPVFQRRIEFHLARNPFNPYSSNSGSDFHMEILNPGPDSQRPASKAGGGGSASAAKKLDGGGELFEHGLDPELRFEITFRRIGAGLANLGNTCFLNSVLQCLTYTEPFAAYLQSGKHKSSCHTAGFCALCAIQNHVMSALQSTGKILSPLHLVKNLRCISRNFRNSRQEDAHEYMVNLLESMHKCCLPPGVSSESPSAYEKSLVHKIFGGSLRSQVKCMQCSYGSNKFDPFLDLSLEIVKADSLRKALAHFTAMEQLDGGQRQYQCQRCKVKVKALKQLTVHKAPYVLAIHLKRFGPDVPGQKIDKRVEFGPTLDLKPFVSGSYEGELKYTLYGVLVHAGWSTHSGHYYCFVRTSSGMWYSLDDRRVVQVSERTVLEQKAYMLFYVRDRRSTTLPKKPLNIVRNLSATANGTGNRELHIPTTGLKSECQSSELERRLDASKYAASLTKTEVSFVQPISAVDSSSKEPLVKEESGLQSGGQVTAQVVQQLTIMKGPMPSPKSTSLKKSSLLEVENLPKTVSKTEKGSVSTSIKGHDATSSTEIQGLSKGSIVVVSQQSACSGLQNPSSKKLLTENCVLKGPMPSQKSTSLKKSSLLEVSKGSIVVVSQQSACSGLQNPSSKKLLTENCILKGPMPSQKSTSLKKSSLLEVENLPKTVSETEKGSVSASIKGHDATSSTEIQGPSKGSIVVVSQQSAGSGLQNPSSKKFLTENCMHENGNVMNDRGPSNSPCKKASDAEFMKIGVAMLLGQSGAANGCIHEKSIEQTSGKQNAAVLNEKEPLDSTCMEHKGDVILPLKHKSKKPLKHPVMRSMPLGPRQLFLKSLCLRKKKKHKRRKHGLDIKKLHLKGTMEDSNDPGTSTSENVRMADFDLIPVQPKCRRHCSTFKKRHVHGEVRTSISACKGNSFENKGKCSEESSQQIAARATDELSEKMSSAAANQVDVQDKRASIQHDLKNTLTMGLKQPTVACWADIGPSSSETLGLNDAQNCGIGYVVDEWDEEYDRGKRKKIRKSSHSFGGLNPFQKIATKKAQIKKMKMTKDQTSDQISAGNLPFRI